MLQIIECHSPATDLLWDLKDESGLSADQNSSSSLLIWSSETGTLFNNWFLTSKTGLP